eukprot:g17036.t1
MQSNCIFLFFLHSLPKTCTLNCEQKYRGRACKGEIFLNKVADTAQDHSDICGRSIFAGSLLQNRIPNLEL